MKILVERYNYDDKQTLGRLHLLTDEDHIIKTWDSLELPWKDNEVRVSCIPELVYTAHKHISPRFGKCLWIKDVPNRSEILVHKGNFFSDILGCILIGSDLSDINNDGYLDVVSSRNAIKELLELTEGINTLEFKVVSMY
tara:strand:- start:28122 stop:28541 length:420 start_codon:yes stop_codon:yes gene_type:complete